MMSKKTGALTELKVMQKEMDRLMEQSRHRMNAETAEESWQPPADICESEQHLIVTMELPEMDREEIRIRIENGYLVIEGERHADLEEQIFYHRIERSYGAFRRSFLLTTEVDSDRISASCNRGVLKVVLPKRRRGEPREIEILND